MSLQFRHLLCFLALLSGSILVAQSPDNRPGYSDTAFLPGAQWRVHDQARPYPRVVAPMPLFLKPPQDATVLFDGTGTDQWQGKGGKAKWTVADGCMTVNGTGSIRTRQSFGSCQLHLEWASPRKVKGNGQGRGNSGVFFMNRYELQILDSFKNNTYADGQAAALYGQYPPLVNACCEPGEWQSYDVFFTAPVFKDGKVIQPARITALHNGYVVHNNRAFIGGTSHRSRAKYAAHAATAPIQIQDHGNPVRFRNIWIRPTDEQASAGNEDGKK